MINFGTFKILILEAFEYVTRPKVKTLDEPPTEVIALESRPPVHDSAKAILSFFFIKSDTIFLFIIIK